MNELRLADLYEAAVRASINERCAPAYLHDIRGSLQALFGAFELLGRSARSGAGDIARVEKACDLARRAISRHEQLMTDALQVLTTRQSMAEAVDLGELTRQVVYFLRSEAGIKSLHVKVAAAGALIVRADRAKLRTLLAGLLTAAIDDAQTGSEMPVKIDRAGDDVAVSIGSTAGYRCIDEAPDLSRPFPRLQAKELTMLFAREFLAANGGRLTLDTGFPPNGSLTIYYPVHQSA